MQLNDLLNQFGGMSDEAKNGTLDALKKILQAKGGQGGMSMPPMSGEVDMEYDPNLKNPYQEPSNGNGQQAQMKKPMKGQPNGQPDDKDQQGDGQQQGQQNDQTGDQSGKKSQSAGQAAKDAQDAKEAGEEAVEASKELIDNIDEVIKEARKAAEAAADADPNSQENIDAIKEILRKAHNDYNKNGENDFTKNIKDVNKKEADAERAEQARLNRFKNNTVLKYTQVTLPQALSRFARSIEDEGRNKGYANPNKIKYQTWLTNYGTKVIDRGNTYNGQAPVVNVYFDRSGSWSPEWKSACGVAIIKRIKALNVRVKVYYFSAPSGSYPGVSPNEKDCEKCGGTAGSQLIEHIKKTNPKNVVIITDSDISDITEAVKVPGSVIQLFVKSSSQNVMENFLGKDAAHTMVVLNAEQYTNAAYEANGGKIDD